MIQWQISHTLATRAENVSVGLAWSLWECVNLASTRWINAIIGQTWKGENQFKARKAKQGPCLIHLANLRVMYECQGTLVRQGDRWVRVGPVRERSGGETSCNDALRTQSSLLETRLQSFPNSTMLGVSADGANGACSREWQKDSLSAPSGSEAELLCKWGAETWLWSAGQQSEYQSVLP